MQQLKTIPEESSDHDCEELQQLQFRITEEVNYKPLFYLKDVIQKLFKSKEHIITLNLGDSMSFCIFAGVSNYTMSKLLYSHDS